MRITNKIMQNNTLTNININKNLQNKLSHQMSTQKLLTRPSDDPVVAIGDIHNLLHHSQQDRSREKVSIAFLF